MRSFETWTEDDVCDTFGIVHEENHAILMEWIETPQPEWTLAERTMLENLKKLANRQVETWNEDELKLLLLGPILYNAELYQKEYKIFSQRTFTAKINDIEVGGKVDFLVAQGNQKPKHPFFFIHEYKQEKKRDSDPRGQLLIAMLAAQAKNGNNFPIYGAYVNGRNWFFVILTSNFYSVSTEFSATHDSIFQIVTILRKVNDYIQIQLKAQNA